MCPPSSGHPELPFELWQLGEDRNDDQCLATYADAAAASADQKAMTKALPDKRFEVRRKGVPLSSPDVPRRLRGTRPMPRWSPDTDN